MELSKPVIGVSTELCSVCWFKNSTKKHFFVCFVSNKQIDEVKKYQT